MSARLLHTEQVATGRAACGRSPCRPSARGETGWPEGSGAQLTTGTSPSSASVAGDAADGSAWRPAAGRRTPTGVGRGTRRPLAGSTSPSMTAPLNPGLPRHRRLSDQKRETTPRDPREQPMRQHRSTSHARHSRIMSTARHDASPPITHQLVRIRHARSASRLSKPANRSSRWKVRTRSACQAIDHGQDGTLLGREVMVELRSADAGGAAERLVVRRVDSLLRLRVAAVRRAAVGRRPYAARTVGPAAGPPRSATVGVAEFRTVLRDTGTVACPGL